LPGLNRLWGHVIKFAANVFWSYLYLSHYPHNSSMWHFKPTILSTLSVRVEQKSWSMQQDMMFWFPTLSLIILGVGIAPLSEGWPWLPLTFSLPHQQQRCCHCSQTLSFSP
jgi:hypothetical protein